MTRLKNKIKSVTYICQVIGSKIVILLKDTRGFAVIDIPNEVMESVARALYPNIVKFFEIEENQKAYTEWLKTQDFKDGE